MPVQAKARRAGSRRPELRIDLDPVGPHLRPELMTAGVGKEYPRRLQRHVAIHAAPQQLVSVARKESTVLDGVTGETAPGEHDDVPLLAVHVVAGAAGHLR